MEIELTNKYSQKIGNTESERECLRNRFRGEVTENGGEFMLLQKTGEKMIWVTKVYLGEFHKTSHIFVGIPNMHSEFTNLLMGGSYQAQMGKESHYGTITSFP